MRIGDKHIGFCPEHLWKQELNLRSCSFCSFPMKTGVLRNFVNFIEKHLYWSLFLIELQAKRLKHRCFPVEFTKFLKIYDCFKIKRLLLKPVVSPGVYLLVSYTLAQIDTWFLYHSLQFRLPIFPSLLILLILLYSEAVVWWCSAKTGVLMNFAKFTRKTLR